MEKHNENFTPHDLSLDLKHLGYDQPSFARYRRGTFQLNVLGKPHSYNTNEIVVGDVSAPLWQEAFNWVREKYNLDSYVRRISRMQWEYGIEYIMQSDSEEEWKNHKKFVYNGNTQFEAQYECLKKLIETIVIRTMENFKETLEVSLTDYINQKKTQSECVSYIEGYEKALQDTKANEMLEAIKSSLTSLKTFNAFFPSKTAKGIIEKNEKLLAEITKK